jgi:HEXXH motif-containing protein
MSELVAADFAYLRGLTPSVSHIFHKARQRSLIGIAAAAKLLALKNAPLMEEAGFEPSYGVLREARPETVASLAGRPEFYYWSQHLVNLLQQMENGATSQESLVHHLLDFGGLAAAVLLAEKRAGEVQLRLDDQGQLWIPGSTVYLSFGKHLAGARGHLRTDGRQLEVALRETSERLVITDELLEQSSDWLRLSVYAEKVRRTYRIGQQMEVTNVSELLRTPGNRLYKFATVDHEAWRGWRTSVEVALTSLKTFARGAYDEVTGNIRVLIPVQSEGQDVNVSASLPNLLGAIYLSWSADYLTVVETLVHEYAHNKLNALFISDEIIKNAQTAAPIYSPWKDQLRPLTGVMHAIFAFENVCQTWQHYLRSEDEFSEETLLVIRRRSYELHMQVMAAIEGLDESAEYTPLGAELMQHIRTIMVANEPLLSKLPAGEREQIDEQLYTHRLMVTQGAV